MNELRTKLIHVNFRRRGMLAMNNWHYLALTENAESKNTRLNDLELDDDIFTVSIK